MESILLKANAKINWTLKVVGRREDGYHDLDMLLSSVTLYDRVRITRVPFKGIKLQTYGRFVLNGEKNIAYKAAERFYSELGRGRPAGLIYKSIYRYAPAWEEVARTPPPRCMGLTSFTDGPFRRKLASLGAQLGADVPFMLCGGPGQE